MVSCCAVDRWVVGGCSIIRLIGCWVRGSGRVLDRTPSRSIAPYLCWRPSMELVRIVVIVLVCIVLGIVAVAAAQLVWTATR